MLCYELYSRAVLDRWANWLDEIEEELTEEELKEIEEQPIEPIFIPFPGFTKKVQPAPYRRTDPEWQAYVRVSQDEELTKSIRCRFVLFFLVGINCSPTVRGTC